MLYTSSKEPGRERERERVVKLICWVLNHPVKPVKL